MLARTKIRHTKNESYKIIIMAPNKQRVITYIPHENLQKFEAFLDRYAEFEEDEPVEWEVLAKDRIKKYKKSGLVLRGMRFREGFSQKELAKRSKVTQNDISKIENGKRPVGEKVAKRLAKVLHFDYKLLTEE